jgi:hypothetical protein
LFGPGALPYTGRPETNTKARPLLHIRSPQLGGEALGLLVMNSLEVAAAARKVRGHASGDLGLRKHALEPVSGAHVDDADRTRSA